MNATLHMELQKTPAAEILVISDVSGFDALGPEWEALFAAAGSSVFKSFIWQRGWWRHHGEDFTRRLLHLVTIREAGELIALAPFYIDVHRHNALASTRTLRFIGTGFSDHLDMLVRPGHADTAIPALAGHLASLWKSLDAIELVEIPEESRVHRQLGAALAALGIDAAVEICDRCPRLTLAGTWEDTLANTSGDFRRKLRAREKRLTEHAKVGFETIEDPTTFETAMDDFVLLHRARLKDKVGTSVYCDDRNERFHREVCREMFRRGWLFLSFLTFNGERVMGNCYYILNNKVYCHLGGARDLGEAWNHSPGIVFESYCMQEALRRGVRVYDFLRGTEPYKYRFGAADKPNWRISIRRVRTSVKLLKPVGAALGRTRRLLVFLPMITMLVRIRMLRP